MEHWARITRHWALLGPPLRPSPEDIAIAAHEARGARRMLVLGATPELAALSVPERIAIDRARAMIDVILPRGVPALLGDWRALPLAAGSIDLVCGDGALACLPFPDGTRALAAELARVLAPGGRAVLRLFASPPARESLDDVRTAIGSIEGFHAFKWRLAMAIASADREARVADVWRAFEAIAPDRAALPWPRAVVDTIDAYRDSPISLWFPTVDETRAALAPLVEVACHTPSYELGDRCPTLVLRVR